MKPPTSQAVPPVPIQEAVGEFVTALVGHGSSASKVRPPRITDDGSHLVAVYRDDVGRTAALVTADLAFAAGASAAFAMIPATAADEAVARSELGDTLLENFHELANITASLLNTPSTPHLSLVGAWPSDDPELPPSVWELLTRPSKRREFAVTIDGYGGGHLGIVIG